ncbi:RING-H2 finger protein ATL66 [Raphanus sativus]|uniref:RING-type E3 ubiquitin transferase n=1 Tax=Raphanus sativus TaxID=3726 RepID=A0A9W3CSK9_RAPSA|nr:RING-H2 finger protein ATL66-like [Raphanus sativus]KAJ4869942.1 RING-H2 finger protein ATL66 [Raphanus sativus]
MTSSSPPPRASMLLYWHENQYDDRNFQFHGRTIFSVMVLFSVILFFAVITLYIHRSCLVRDPVNLNAPPPPIFTPCVGGGLDPAEIRSLPVVLCRREDAEEEERECCICLGGLEEGEKVKVLPLCRHCYHCECVDRWLMAESSCPLCRVSIRVDSSVSLQ